MRLYSRCAKRARACSARSEGAGNAGCSSRTRGLACNKKSTQANSPQVSQTIRHSPRDGFTASFALFPVIGRFCHRRRPGLPKHPRQLDVSVETSEPHDFAVRNKRIRLLRRRVHRILRPTFSDDRETPLRRAEDGRQRARDLPDVTSELACDTLARRANQMRRPRWCQGLLQSDRLFRSLAFNRENAPIARDTLERVSTPVAEA
jgi:hypothetical protein